MDETIYVIFKVQFDFPLDNLQKSDRIFLTAENPVQLDFIALIIMVKLSITLQVQEI